MASDNTQASPLLMLPRHVRDKIYSELLCCFDPPPPEGAPVYGDHRENPRKFETASHSVDTAILRVNTQIHREAYEIMVQTNQFVQVKNITGIALQSLLHMRRTPFIPADTIRADQFRGYVLSVCLSTANPIKANEANKWMLESRSLMVLGRDLNRMCEAFGRYGEVIIPGFGVDLKMTVTVAPGLSKMQPWYKASLTKFLDIDVQASLLQPFRTHIRGLKGLTINGCVSPDLAKAVKKEAAQNEYIDYQEVLNDFLARNEEAKLWFRLGKFCEASGEWFAIKNEIMKVRMGSSWNNMVKHGGMPFIDRMAELAFLISLNILHVQNVCKEKGHMHIQAAPFTTL